MNDERRKEINRIIGILDSLQADIENLANAEQDAFDGLPEGLQQSEKGEKMEAGVEALHEAKECLENAVSNLETAAE